MSVGEAGAALRVAEALRAVDPELAILTTAHTPGGRAVLERAPAERPRYAPLDLPWAVRHFLDSVQPRALVLMETELWPGWLRAAKARGIPVILANGRLSERSARRYRRLGGFGREMFSAIDLCAAVAEADAERFRTLGVSSDAVAVLGNLKFDAPPAPLPADLEALPAGLLAGCSTHPSEEALLLRAFTELRKRRADVRLLLAPRHPQRAAEVAALARRHAVRVALRSDWQGHPFDVLVLDTLGELAGILHRAHVAFIGGTFAAVGGHSPIESAAAGVPALSGPEIFKIEALARELEASGALERCTNGDELTRKVILLYDDAAEHARRSQAALGLVERARGASTRLAERVYSMLPDG